MEIADESLKKFLNTWDGSGDVIDEYNKYIKNANSATSAFSATLKSVVANMAIMLAINAVIKAVAWAWDEFNTTVAETKSDLDETQSTISSLKTQIEELEKIDANALTQGQKDKLENLKEQLKVQEQLEEIEKRRLARETIGNGNFTDYFDKDSYKNAHVGIMKDLTKYQGDIDGLAPLYEKRSESVKRKSILVNEGLETSTDVSGLQESLRRAEEKQDKTRQEILLLQEGLISNKADIQNWINTIEGYISDGSLVGEDLTQANEDLKELYGNLEYVNGQLTYTNNLLYGGDDSWENVLAEKTQYSLKNLKDYGFTDGELEILSTLTFDHDNTLTELRTILNESQKVVDENPVTPKVEFSKTQMIDTINSMADGFDVLDDIYADVLDGGTFDFTKLDTSKFNEAFSEITPEYEKFIETVSSSPTDIDVCQSAFNELVTAFINSKGILENLTEDNAQLTASMLKNMGVANAEEIVMAQLAYQTEALSMQKQFCAVYGYELANATYAEASEFINEAECSAVAKQELAQLALEKINVNNQTIDTSADIENVIALANAANASALAISKLKSAQTVMSSYESGGLKSGAISMMDVREAQKVIDSIENGSFNYDYQPLKASDYLVTSNSKYTPKYSGADQTASAIEKANKSASDSAKDATEEAKKAYSDWFDFMERRTKVLEDSFSLLETGMENVVGAFAKNKLVDAMLGNVNEQINNYTDALAMYKEQANNVLATIEDADLREKIVNGAVELTQIQGDNADVVKAAMEAYEGWADKASECATKIEELKTQVRELTLQKFNNIIEDFTNQFDLFGDSIDLIKGQIGLLESANELVGSSYYTKQIEQSQKQLNLLEEEKATLVKQMTEAINSGRIQKGTEEWLEMQNALTQVESEIIDVKTSIEELDNELLDINWQIFERVQTEIGNINDELGNLVGLFDDFNDINVSDGKGTWTNEAIATLGLYAQQYEAAKQQVQDYSDAIAQLEVDYKAGKYSSIEYLDKLAELKEAQWDCVNSAESMEDAIISLNETRINEEIETIEKEIDSYKELIDAQIETLEAEKDLHDYRKSITEQTKTIADIEKQLVTLENDNSQSAIAKKKKLEEQLAEEKTKLEELEYEHSIDQQRSALESQLEDYENARNAEIELLENSLNDRENLIAQSFETVKQNADVVGQEIALIAQEHGVVVSDAIITSWANGETAIASYGTVLSAESSAFIANIMGVENEVYALQSQADTASVAISNMFGQRADNLVSQLVNSYTAEDNLNNATNILQNSLINTLERGYNISSTTSALDSIASSANGVTSAATAAANALADLMKAQVAQSTTIQKPTVIKTNTTGYTGASSNTINAGHKYLVSAKAKGGIISKDDDGVLDPIAKALGEDTMFAAKYGESVLSKEQTKILQEFSEALENGTSSQYLGLENTWSKNTVVPNYVVKNDMPEMEKTTTNNNVTLHFNKLAEFNGDFNNIDQIDSRMMKIATKATAKVLDEVDTHFRITGR